MAFLVGLLLGVMIPPVIAALYVRHWFSTRLKDDFQRISWP